MTNINYSLINGVVLGEQIRLSRIKLGISQIELAHMLVCTQSYMSRLEQGLATPGLEMMLRIASLLHMSLDETFLVEYGRDPDLRQLLLEISLLPFRDRCLIRVLVRELRHPYSEETPSSMAAEPSAEYLSGGKKDPDPADRPAARGNNGSGESPAPRHED